MTHDTKIASFPTQGTAPEKVLEQLKEIKSRDWSHDSGRLPLHGYFADDSVSKLAEDAHNLFHKSNALAPIAFPSCRVMEEEVVAMALDLLGGTTAGSGNITSGGSESIILSVKTARDRARGNGLRERGSIVVPSSAHPAFNKAAHFLDVDILRVQVATDWRSDIKAMRAAIRPDTFYIAGSAPSLPYGLFDRLSELGSIAEERGLWFHVDACIGGFLAPFVSQAGYSVPVFDFSLPGVRSISADLHKFGFASKGSSLILYRSALDHEFQVHRFADWPKGEYYTPTIAGTRSGGPIASAWAVIKYLGAQGYTGHALRLMQLRDRYIAGISAIRGLRILGTPELSVITTLSDAAPILHVAAAMGEKGWYMSVVGDPPGIQQTITLIHEKVITQYLADLGDAVSSVLNGNIDIAQTVTTY